MVDTIDIHDITLEELSGVVSLYPWYAGARMELCRRMADAGALSEREVAETALHLGDRKTVSALLRNGRNVDCSDRDTRRLVESFIPDPAPQAPAPRYVVAGGDYFSQDQYETVRRDGDMEITGEITGYNVAPASVSANEVATQNRLTVTVRVSFTNRKYPEDDFDAKSFSAYADYDTANTLDAVESTLCAEIVDKLIEDIFNATVAQW